MKTLWQKILSASIAALLLIACDPKVAERGKLELVEMASEIIPGSSNRSDVLSRLGTPSATGQFGDRAWYYVSQRKEGIAFFAPEVVDSQALRITFEGDIVSELKLYNQDDVRDVSFNDRETPTAGHEFGFVEQLIGNIGKFNQNQDSVGPAPGRR
jgi:outer membrane protein assembly factor BamE (lipoprotein component of BamABCDE complex)